MKYYFFVLSFLFSLSLVAQADSITLNDGESVTVGTTVVSCGRSPTSTCVPFCLARNSSGVCFSYGQDYCGINAQCAADCSARSSNGTCYAYAQDVCGDNAQCSTNCTARNSSGVCYVYGPDSCTTETVDRLPPKF